ncbi:hypothetical protein J2S48_001551 [Promicromonospora iranensis]|uniref:Tetratricopeptide repeat protein n=1 Tax=Promicromonospora iranensis TaxID=1105144 RepID=A0ABU2CL46_9MICO|nr:hypothetical protein [Promicromonospora iranensis]
MTEAVLTDEVLHQEVQDLVRALQKRQKVAVPDVVATLVRVGDAGERSLAADLAGVASVRFPGRVRMLLACAAALEATDQPAAAVPHLRKALERGTGNDRRTARRLARALVASGAPVADVDDAYARVLRDEPTSRPALDEWRAVARGTDDVPWAERLSALQAGADDPLPVVLHELLRGPEAETERRAQSGALTAFLAGDEARACAAVWAAYAALEPLPATDADRVAALPAVVKDLYFLAAVPRIVTPEEAVADGVPLSADAIAWWREEFLAPDVPQPDDREFVTLAQRQIADADDPHLAHQTRAVRERRLVLRDPLTGAECAPFDALVSFGKAVYSFGDREHTMLLSLGAGFKAAYVFLPARGVLLDLGATFGRPILPPHKMVNLLTSLLDRVVAERDRYAGAVASRPDPRTERTVVLQMTVAENFAHHVWNFHPGVERLVEHGVAANVAEVRTVGTRFFGAFLELFPEFSGARVVDEPRRGVRDPYPFSHEHLVVSVGGYFIRRSLVERIRQSVARADPTPGYAQPPSTGARSGPVVWIGLRVRSRAWADQEHEVARFIDALHLRYPRALVLLDGYSYPMDNDLVSERWQSSIDELHTVSRAIKEGARHGDQVVDLVGSSLREAVLWAEATDVYVAPNGTSQHKVGWFSDAPGVVYAPASLGAVPPERRPGAREAEGRPVPVTLFGEAAGEGERRGGNDVRDHLENLWIDRGQLLATVCDLLDSRLATSSSRSRQASLYRRGEKLLVTRLAPRLSRRASRSSSST